MSNKLAIGLVITAGVTGAVKSISKVRNSLKILQDQNLTTSKKMVELAKTGTAGFTALTSSISAAMGTVRGLADPAIKFESAMADVKKVVNFDTPTQFKEMGDDILNLTRTIPMAGKKLPLSLQLAVNLAWRGKIYSDMLRTRPQWGWRLIWPLVMRVKRWRPWLTC